MKINRICIIGLGLIGGSIAKAISSRGKQFTIIGIDKNESFLSQAYQEGVIHEFSTNACEGVRDADLIFICTPVSNIIETILEISQSLKSGAILTDVGSTKHQIMYSLRQHLPSSVYFIGGHPMAGTEKSGYVYSSPHLFENAYYILTPFEDTPSYIENALRDVILQLGSIPITLSPEKHDHIVGIISHLPHVIAAVLVNLARNADEPDYIQRLAAGGFKDITRIASSNPSMWRDICIANSSELQHLIQRFRDTLTTIENAIIQKDGEAIQQFFHHSKVFRDNLPIRAAFYSLPYFDIFLDIEDRPGIIGEISTLLGNHQVNIKNIGIMNSREEEPGVLVISLPDIQSQSLAEKILQSNGYKVYKK